MKISPEFIFRICQLDISQALKQGLPRNKSFTYAHLENYVNFWTQLQSINLDEEVEDDITWTLSSNNIYSKASGYKAHVFSSNIDGLE
jgi:hypothetical protein